MPAQSSRRWRSLFAIVFSILPFVVRPLEAQSIPAEEAVLRGELVRFPDARLNVSVFAGDAESIPLSLWGRIGEARDVSFFGGGSTEVNESVRTHLSTLPGIETVNVAGDPSELAPVGVQVTEDDEIRLAWYGLTEGQGVAILADGRAVDERFTLRILIPNSTDTEDWWGLQAALSQAGIRRVQILSRRP